MADDGPITGGGTDGSPARGRPSEEENAEGPQQGPQQGQRNGSSAGPSPQRRQNTSNPASTGTGTSPPASPSQVIAALDFLTSSLHGTPDISRDGRTKSSPTGGVRKKRVSLTLSTSADADDEHEARHRAYSSPPSSPGHRRSGSRGRSSSRPTSPRLFISGSGSRPGSRAGSRPTSPQANNRELPQSRLIESRPEPTLTAVVWKRRSGYLMGGKKYAVGKGKKLYTSKNAWERRRIALRGCELMYYKTAGEDSSSEVTVSDRSAAGAASVASVAAAADASLNSASAAADGSFDNPAVAEEKKAETEAESEVDSTRAARAPRSPQGGSGKKKASSSSASSTSTSSWLYSNVKDGMKDAATYAASTVTYAAATMTDAAATVAYYGTGGMLGSSGSSGNEPTEPLLVGVNPKTSAMEQPRGVLHLVRERATVAATRGGSGGGDVPTSFSLSVKVKGDTYWKFCFDTYREQMDWLAVLTDVVVEAGRAEFEKQNGQSDVSGRELRVSWDEDDEDEDAERPQRLESMVWKQRSGFGKRIKQMSWEQRTLVLEGSVLSYYRFRMPSAHGDDGDDDDDEEIFSNDDDASSVEEEEAKDEDERGGVGSAASADFSAVEAAQSSESLLSQDDVIPIPLPQDHPDASSRSPSGGSSPTSTTKSSGKLSYSEYASYYPTKLYKKTKVNLKYATTNMTGNVTNMTKNINITMPTLSSSSGPGRQAAQSPTDSSAGNNGLGISAPPRPRGSLDVIAEDATAVASYPTGGAPTPYVLSVGVRGETKWRFCLNSREDQARWLAVLTDLVVARSVEEHNRNRASSTSGGGASPFGPVGAPARPLRFVLQARRAVGLGRGGGGGGAADALSDAAASSARGVAGVEERGAYSGLTSSASVRGGDGGSLPASPLRIRPHPGWTVTPRGLLSMLTLVNGSLLYSRAHPLSVEHFWYMFAIVNVGIWLCLSSSKKEEGTTKQMVAAAAEATVLTDMPAQAAFVPPVVPVCDGDDKGNVAKDASEIPEISAKSAAAVPGATQVSAVCPTFQPKAGTTTMRIEEPTDAAIKNGHRFAGWRAMPGSIFDVRSHGYLSTKTKVPSPSELYRLVTVDIFESGARVPDIAGKVQLPAVAYDDGETEKTWVSPDVFVVSFALPTEAPSIYRPSTDGQGYTVTMYYAMKEETRAILRKVTSPGYDAASDDASCGEEETDVQKQTRNGVRLWEHWCRRAPTDEQFQARFKVIINGHNLEEIGIPNWIARYNAKPFLIKRAGVTGFLYEHRDLSAMEFDISFHQFPYLFKQGTALLKESFFKKVLASLGFVIEGRDDDELPEVIIGEGMQICYPDPSIAIQAEDLFRGTSPSSLDS